MNVVMAYFATPYHLPAGDPIPDCAKEDGADTAIFVLSRIAGEGTDRRDEELDYYLSKDERAMLDQLSACYKHIIHFAQCRWNCGSSILRGISKD